MSFSCEERRSYFTVLNTGACVIKAHTAFYRILDQENLVLVVAVLHKTGPRWM